MQYKAFGKLGFNCFVSIIFILHDQVMCCYIFLCQFNNHILYILISITSLILLFFPGIYVVNRLIFINYIIAIENCSAATEGLSRSWELTKGHWWLIWRSSLLLSPIFFIGGILIGLNPKSIQPILFQVIMFLGVPLIKVNFVILYMRLANRDKNTNFCTGRP